jgi:hypothetical protein
LVLAVKDRKPRRPLGKKESKSVRATDALCRSLAAMTLELFYTEVLRSLYGTKVDEVDSVTVTIRAKANSRSALVSGVVGQKHIKQSAAIVFYKRGALF